MKTTHGGKKKSHGLMVIAVFKLAEGLGLLALGFGVRHALHTDWAKELAHWIDLLRMDPHNRYLLWAVFLRGAAAVRRDRTGAETAVGGIPDDLDDRGAGTGGDVRNLRAPELATNGSFSGELGGGGLFNLGIEEKQELVP